MKELDLETDGLAPRTLCLEKFVTAFGARISVSGGSEYVAALSFARDAASIADPGLE